MNSVNLIGRPHRSLELARPRRHAGRDPPARDPAPAQERRGPAAPTTSTSSCSAARPRPARSTSPRAARSPSTAACRHSEWDAEDGSRRQKLEVIANTVEFLDRAAASEEPELVEAA